MEIDFKIPDKKSKLPLASKSKILRVDWIESIQSLQLEWGEGGGRGGTRHDARAARLLSSKYGGFHELLAVFEMSEFQGELWKSTELSQNFSK